MVDFESVVLGKKLGNDRAMAKRRIFFKTHQAHVSVAEPLQDLLQKVMMLLEGNLEETAQDAKILLLPVQDSELPRNAELRYMDIFDFLLCECRAQRCFGKTPLVA